MLGFQQTLRKASKAMPQTFGRPGQLGSVNT
jgi:hypothetical protein